VNDPVFAACTPSASRLGPKPAAIEMRDFGKDLM
jgi:hypothetical protein